MTSSPYMFALPRHQHQPRHDFSTSTALLLDESSVKEMPPSPTPEGQKKLSNRSKFRQLYTQYGPICFVVHFTTVVLWIYFFYILSKLGLDITNFFVLLEKLNIVSTETVTSLNHKIDTFETKWVSGPNLKHFATAYIIYKVIAPFRYVVSIWLTVRLVPHLRRLGLLKP